MIYLKNTFTFLLNLCCSAKIKIEGVDGNDELVVKDNTKPKSSLKTAALFTNPKTLEETPVKMKKKVTFGPVEQKFYDVSEYDALKSFSDSNSKVLSVISTSHKKEQPKATFEAIYNLLFLFPHLFVPLLFIVCIIVINISILQQ